jgi:hypothetical protein
MRGFTSLYFWPLLLSISLPFEIGEIEALMALMYHCYVLSGILDLCAPSSVLSLSQSFVKTKL